MANDVPLGGGRTVLYRHYDADDRLLYVGISGSPEARTRQHKYNADWIEQAVRFTGIWYRTRLAALAAERRAIVEEQPLHNRQGIKQRTRKPNQRRTEPFDGVAIFSFRLDESMISDIDQLAADEGTTRSAMIRTLLDEGAVLARA